MLQPGDKVHVSINDQTGRVIMCWEKDAAGVVLVNIDGSQDNPVWFLLRHVHLVQ